MANDRRVAAIIIFSNRARALDGMAILEDLGYRCIERDPTLRPSKAMICRRATNARLG
jgi:hypothetical protein